MMRGDIPICISPSILPKETACLRGIGIVSVGIGTGAMWILSVPRRPNLPRLLVKMYLLAKMQPFLTATAAGTSGSISSKASNRTTGEAHLLLLRVLVLGGMGGRHQLQHWREEEQKQHGRLVSIDAHRKVPPSSIITLSPTVPKTSSSSSNTNHSNSSSNSCSSRCSSRSIHMLVSPACGTSATLWDAAEAPAAHAAITRLIETLPLLCTPSVSFMKESLVCLVTGSPPVGGVPTATVSSATTPIISPPLLLLLVGMLLLHRSNWSSKGSLRGSMYHAILGRMIGGFVGLALLSSALLKDVRAEKALGPPGALPKDGV